MGIFNFVPNLAGKGKAIQPANPNNPRKVTNSSSSLTANGVIPASPDMGLEQGSSTPVVVRELVPALASQQQRTLTYASMMNDAGVDVSMRVVKTPVLGATFYMDPHSDQQIDQDISEFVWANLAEGMSSPFLNSLEDILKFYETGYSVLEKSYELRQWSSKKSGANNKQYTMLKKLGVRPSGTIKEITYDDNGGPTGVVQNAIKADGTNQEVTLDISKLLIFTFGRNGGDLTGKSLLRTAYPHWYYKTHFYKIDAIQKERHSLGVPIGKLLPGYNPKDKSILRDMLRNLRANEESFMVLTPNVEVEFAELHGNLVDVLSSANHHNVMILMNVLAQFMAMGTETSGGGGGRSTAGAHTDIFMKALKFVANYICDLINMYLIPELVVWNFPTTNFPKLCVRNIGETADLQKIAAALANVYAQGVITPDPETENWARQLFDMPTKKAGAPSVPASQVGQQNNTGATPANNGNNNNGNGSNNGTNGNQKGNPKGEKGGNVPKPANAAESVGGMSFDDLLEAIRESQNEAEVHAGNSPVAGFQTPAPENHLHLVAPEPTVIPAPVSNSPVEVVNNYEFTLPTPDPPSSNSDPKQRLPVVNIHVPGEAPKEIKPKSAIVTNLEDGTTRIDYNYENED